jgi:hypothetical protein
MMMQLLESSLMAAFTSINVYPWDAQVLARYLKNFHVLFNGFFTPKAVSHK